MSNNFSKIAGKDYTKRYKDKKYISQRNRDAWNILKKITKLNILNQNDKILDAGCGTGELGSLIKRNFSAVVYGMDINREAVKKAKKNGLLAQIANIEKKWPFENNLFDTIISTQMIEHLFNPDFFLLESKRVLNKNGLLIITTPNLAAWFNRFIFLFGYQPFFTEVSTIDKTLGLSFTRNLTSIRAPLGHLRCFTLKALKDILELHGFELVKVQGSAVSYFPMYISIFDKFFSHFPSLSSDLFVVAKKRKD